MSQLPHFSRRRAVLTAVASGASSIAAFPGLAHAQAFPNRPIRLVVPVAAGGGTDLVARVVADALSRSMGQAWVVQNQHAGTVGASLVSVERLHECAHVGRRVLVAIEIPRQRIDDDDLRLQSKPLGYAFDLGL